MIAKYKEVAVVSRQNLGLDVSSANGKSMKFAPACGWPGKWHNQNPLFCKNLAFWKDRGFNGNQILLMGAYGSLHMNLCQPSRGISF